MLRSLFSGISGLRAHQQMMDVTGNNIANVNTVGYKSSSVIFEDTLSQSLKSASAPRGANAGINPAQIGLGVQVGQIKTNLSQGSAQATGSSSDVLIQGDGYFVVNKGGQQLYTRDGAFTFDTNGTLNLEGAAVQGWAANNGVVNTGAKPGPINVQVGLTRAPTATTTATVGGNLPADTTDPVAPITIKGYDAQGNAKNIQLAFTKVSATSWSIQPSDASGPGTAVPVTFAADGTTPSPTTFTHNGVAVDLTGLTDFAGTNSVGVKTVDGEGSATLTSYSISNDGTLVGAFSDGTNQPLGRIAMANFNNPAGLEKAGGSLLRGTAVSGNVQIGEAGTGGRGDLVGGQLEMSNVDLAQEFTNLIIAQRGFQANSKVITTSDQLLQDLVNLKQ